MIFTTYLSEYEGYNVGGFPAAGAKGWSAIRATWSPTRAHISAHTSTGMRGEEDFAMTLGPKGPKLERTAGMLRKLVAGKARSRFEPFDLCASLQH